MLAAPGGLRFFVPAAIARLGVAMSRLAVLWAVQSAAGSFAQAGAATGAFAIADAAVGPQVARLIDRWGQRRVVSATATLFLLSCAMLATGCMREWPLPAPVALAGLAGASAPPVGALIQAHGWPAGFLATTALTALPPALLLPAARHVETS
ncbi:MFS transporter [Brachybacterium hainanense]|uniref:MFS transporter n=1 Tax=Brachybacterium hainanense TaxID=1541174 RepID=A0ABV6R652_9MICO